MEEKNSILIVDDDTSNLMELTHILKSDYKVRAVRDGTSALENAKEYLPDIILLDVIMPDMNGFEVLAELKKTDKTKAIPVIFITGMKESVNESEGLTMGAVDYIRKPFDTTVVKLRVSQQLKIINLQRELERAVAVAENAAKAAEAASKSKSSFLTNMSHEIRTPMNAIMGITDILMQSQTLPDEIAEGLDKIYASSEMLLGIINDILDFSKIEAGKLDIIPAQYKVASMVNDAIHLNMMRIGNRPITFELKIEGDVPAELIGDELRIKQILNNLLSNAFKYTDAGKVTMSFIAEWERGKEDVVIVLNVEDTGHGMTREQLDKLFDEYSRFNEEANRNIEGTGLGLSITQHLVNLMDGQLSVESEPDKGTSVSIRLPQKAKGSEILGDDVAENLRRFRQSSITYSEKRKLEREPMPYGNVLIVDDTETNLFVAVRLMKFYKLQIDTAINGREAIDKVKKGMVYDIIFMDHMMPEMDGMEATKHLRDHGYKSPVVALTANAVAGQSDVFLGNGFDDFISKPIDIVQLDNVLNKHIRDKQTPEVIRAARQQNQNTDATVDSSLQIDHRSEPPDDLAMDPQFLESAISDTRKAVNLLDELCLSNTYEKDDDLRRFAITVHGMKSTLRTISQAELSDTAALLEDASRELNIDLIKQVTPGFLKSLRVLQEKLKSKLNECVNDSETHEDPENLHDQLSVIKEMCADYNRKGVLDAVADITLSTKKTKEVLGAVKEHIRNSEFEEAENLIVEYMKEVIR